jgi:hypothetical protein
MRKFPRTLPRIVTPFTAWLETTSISIWVREAPTLLSFPFILIVHAWGMGLLAGGNAALGLRILGFAGRVPLPAMQKFYPVLWFGFVINSISGIFLLLGYPTKALTNPVFYLKLGCIACGMAFMIWLRRHVVRDGLLSGRSKAAAALSLLVWTGAIVSGRLLAYTCRWLMADLAC